jgi:hypothetical protein
MVPDTALKQSSFMREAVHHRDQYVNGVPAWEGTSALNGSCETKKPGNKEELAIQGRSYPFEIESHSLPETISIIFGNSVPSQCRIVSFSKLLAMCLPLVAVTVIVALVGGRTTPEPLPLPLPPPHPIDPKTSDATMMEIRRAFFWFFLATQISMAKRPQNNTEGFLKGPPFKRALKFVATMNGALELPVGPMLDGLTLQVVPAGAPEQVSAIAPAKLGVVLTLKG